MSDRWAGLVKLHALLCKTWTTFEQKTKNPKKLKDVGQLTYGSMWGRDAVALEENACSATNACHKPSDIWGHLIFERNTYHAQVCQDVRLSIYLATPGGLLDCCFHVPQHSSLLAPTLGWQETVHCWAPTVDLLNGALIDTWKE